MPLIIRNWRVERGDPFGAHLWFDPGCEGVILYSFRPAPDSEEAAVGSEGLAQDGAGRYLDSVVSVSATESGGGVVRHGEQLEFLGEDLGLPF